MSARSRRLSRRAAVTVTGAALGLAATTGVGLAYWIATDSTYGAQAVASVLPQGGTPTTTVTGDTVTVSFPQARTSTESGATALTSYTIHRYASATAETPTASISCAATVAGATARCEESAVPEGTWYYSDTPVLARWTGQASGRVAAIVSPADAAPADPASADPASADPASAEPNGPAAPDTSVPVPSGEDTTGPAVSIDTPASSAGPTLTGTYGTASGDTEAVTVQLFAGSSPVGSPLTATLDASTHTWSVTPPALPDGVYTAAASQSDVSGNTTTAASGSFSIDTIAPEPALSASAADGTATFSGSAGTLAGDSSTVTLTIYPGDSATGTPVRALTATATAGRWSVSTSTLGSGRYTATASQSDAAGNTGTTDPVSVSVVVAPTVTVNPVEDESGRNGFTSNPTPTITGTAGTASGDGDVRLTLTDLTTGEAIATRTIAAEGGSWSYTTPELSDGHAFRVDVQQSATVDDTTLSTAVSTTFVTERAATSASTDGA